MKKFFIIIVIIILLAAFGGHFFAKNVVTSEVASRPIPTVTPTPVVFATPVNVKIPKLGVETTIESVGLDSQKNMDVPKNADNVGWFQYGPKPGEKGNAVFAGHVDTVTGAPAVFAKLSKLEKGDEVIVTDINGKAYTFVVLEKNVYPVDTFPVQTVFGKSNDRYLNLITCDGTFSKSRKLYLDRLVVRTKLKDSIY